MLSYDKIIIAVHPSVISTINELVKQKNIERLKFWLEQCKEEIELRKSEKENIYSLYCEMYYLQMVIG